MGLEIAVRSKGFTDMTSPSMFRVQLDRLEIVDIIYDEQSIWIEHNRVGMKCDDIPELKNMYRTVAVFLCTLNGWPVRMMRFAMTRVVSGLRKVPVATTCGATHRGTISANDHEMMQFLFSCFTLWI